MLTVLVMGCGAGSRVKSIEYLFDEWYYYP